MLSIYLITKVSKNHFHLAIYYVFIGIYEAPFPFLTKLQAYRI